MNSRIKLQNNHLLNQKNNKHHQAFLNFELKSKLAKATQKKQIEQY